MSELIEAVPELNLTPQDINKLGPEFSIPFSPRRPKMPNPSNA
jgi:hypothetical protein